MKTGDLWGVNVPTVSEYAELGVFFRRETGERCEVCKSLLGPRVQQARVEWTPGSDKVADFTFAGARLIAKAHVANQIRTQFPEVGTRPIEIADLPENYRPAKLSKKAEPRIWLPYNGPELVELIPLKQVDLEPTSTVEIKARCEKCGAIEYRSFGNVERFKGGKLVPRQPGSGLRLSRREMNAAHLVQPRYTGLYLCDQVFRNFIEAMKFTNIAFLDYGEIVEQE